MDDIRNMDAWLYRVMENKLMDFLRKAAADERMREQIWNALSGEAPSPATITEYREYHALVGKAIDRLPPQRRLIYRLNREEGMSYLEIADELNISRHTVKNQLSSALQAIRSFIVKTSGPLSLFFHFFSSGNRNISPLLRLPCYTPILRMEERIHYLFKRYRDNACTRQEYEEFFALLRQADTDGALRDMIRQVWNSDEALPHAETYVNRRGRLVHPPAGSSGW